MNPTKLQTILQTLLHEQEERNAAAIQRQEQRFVQLLDTLRVGTSVQNGGSAGVTDAMAAILPNGQKHLPAARLPDIEVFMADMENPSHFEDWLKRFEMSLQCTAPDINDK